jgi:hypothetical protein
MVPSIGLKENGCSPRATSVGKKFSSDFPFYYIPHILTPTCSIIRVCLNGWWFSNIWFSSLEFRQQVHESKAYQIENLIDCRAVGNSDIQI